MTTPDSRQDELLARYREASAEDTRRPGAQVREAARRHAEAVLAARNKETPPPARALEAANQSRWKMRAVAGVALAGFAGLLALQFERGTPEEREQAFGQPRASLPAAAPATPQVKQEAPGTTSAPPPQASPAPAAEKKADADRAPSVAPAKPSAPLAKAAPREAEAAASPAAAATGAVQARPFPESAPLQAEAPKAGPALDSARSRDSSPPVLRQAAPAIAPSPAPAAAPPPAPAAATAATAAAMAPQAENRAAPAALKRRAESAPVVGGQAGGLLEAARGGQVTRIEQLVRAGADINTADDNGRTPLMLAVLMGHEDAVARLLALGANPALIDRDGRNALEHARRLGFTRIAERLQAAS